MKDTLRPTPRCYEQRCEVRHGKTIYHAGCDGAFCFHGVCQECGSEMQAATKSPIVRPTEATLPDKSRILEVAEDIGDTTLAPSIGDAERAKKWLLLLGDECYRQRAEIERLRNDNERLMRCCGKDEMRTEIDRLRVDYELLSDDYRNLKIDNDRLRGIEHRAKLARDAHADKESDVLANRIHAIACPFRPHHDTDGCPDRDEWFKAADAVLRDGIRQSKDSPPESTGGNEDAGE